MGAIGENEGRVESGRGGACEVRPASSPASDASVGTDDVLRRQVERSIITDFRPALWTPFTKALKEYRLIEDGDRIAVCVSGGKDSMLLAKLFQELHRHGRANFEVSFLSMDPGFEPDARALIERDAELLGIPLHTVETRIFKIVSNMEGNPCYPCARMRRGALYNAACQMGCNKIALGHHFNDVIETVMMGMLYTGQFKAMMPKAHSENFEGIELIRPLYLVREADIIRWRDAHGLTFIHCGCPLSGGDTSCSAGSGSKRAAVKALIAQMAQTNPDVEKCIFRSAANVNLDAVVGYRVADRPHSFLEHYDAGWDALG